MKNIKNHLLSLTLIVTGSVFFTACGTKSNNTEAHKHESAGAATYACSMHPEVVGQEGETCSKCGMKLVLVNEATHTNTYFMHFSSEPLTLEAGKSALLSFTPKIKGKEGEQVPLDIQHDKKMHLIVVSKDLSYFDHIHPEFTATGAYEIKVLDKESKYTKGRFSNETKFEQGGEYVLFSDYLPSGAAHQLERIELTVAGTPFKAQTFSQAKTINTINGYEVALVPEGGKFFSEGTAHISGILKKDGKEIPADQLENYLGAKAHVVVISEDTKDYLHVHPEVVNGRLDLHTTFGKPGVFRGWMQFQTNGVIQTIDFTILVEDGKAPESAHAESTEHQH